MRGEVSRMYKKSKTDNRFFKDISKPDLKSPAMKPKTVKAKAAASEIIDKKWKKTEEWKAIW